MKTGLFHHILQRILAVINFKIFLGGPEFFMPRPGRVHVEVRQGSRNQEIELSV
jgi:hypothetical protein